MPLITRHASHATPFGRVLIIAGSDSGGGAGIQGDIKTVSAMGGYAMSAITALTAQNTQGVFGIHPVPEDFIAQQIDLCLSDIGADAIKTGMLHSAAVIDTVVACLDAHAQERNAAQHSLPHRGRVGVGAFHTRRFPMPSTLKKARALRTSTTDAEKKLWQCLRHDALGVRFRRQHPVGPFIADFAALDAKLIIELDGGQHAQDVALKNDATRTAFLESQGFSILRFWNHDVLEQTESVLLTIQHALEQASPHPNPPPVGEGTIPLVVDPVMIAKGGAPLLEVEALTALRTKLLPRASIITPNLPEASFLLDYPVSDENSAEAAQALLKLGCKAVLIKGGHGMDETITDVLAVAGQGIITLKTKRISTNHTHGTGCTMASAIATGLAQGLALEAAVRRAHAYVQQAIAAAPGFGQGHGPLGHVGESR